MTVEEFAEQLAEFQNRWSCSDVKCHESLFGSYHAIRILEGLYEEPEFDEAGGCNYWIEENRDLLVELVLRCYKHINNKGMLTEKDVIPPEEVR